MLLVQLSMFSITTETTEGSIATIVITAGIAGTITVLDLHSFSQTEEDSTIIIHMDITTGLTTGTITDITMDSIMGSIMGSTTDSIMDLEAMFTAHHHGVEELTLATPTTLHQRVLTQVQEEMVKQQEAT